MCNGESGKLVGVLCTVTIVSVGLVELYLYFSPRTYELASKTGAIGHSVPGKVVLQKRCPGSL